MPISRSGKKGGKSGKKKRDEACGKPMNTRLYLRDMPEFSSVAKGEFRSNEALAIRELVSEALTTRRLRTVGRDARLGDVKNAQKEVVSGELSDVKSTLAQILSILRGQGTRFDNLLIEQLAVAGVLRPLLASVLHIEELSENHLLRPSLGDKGKDDGAFAQTVEEAEAHWREQARVIVERVKNSVIINDV